MLLSEVLHNAVAKLVLHKIQTENVKAARGYHNEGKHQFDKPPASGSVELHENGGKVKVKVALVVPAE